MKPSDVGGWRVEYFKEADLSTASHKSVKGEPLHSDLHKITSKKRLYKLDAGCILPVRYRDRQVCICVKHQNMDPRMKALEDYMELPNTPDLWSTSTTAAEAAKLMQEKLPEAMNSTKSGRKRLMVMSRGLNSCEASKVDFIPQVTKMMDDFRSCVFRVGTQYKQTKNLKLLFRWTPLRMILLATSIKCKMHTSTNRVLPYTKQWSTISIPKPRVSFLQALTQQVHDDLLSVEDIHYLSDSSTSQYGNRKIFSLLMKHKELFLLNCRLALLWDRCWPVAMWWC